MTLIITAGLASWSGCGPGPCPPTTQGLVRPSAAGLDARLDYSDLASVLAASVNTKGELDDFELRQVLDALERQLALLGIVGPSSTPVMFSSTSDRLAYWYNARMVVGLKLVAMNRPWEIPGRTDANLPPALPLEAFDCQSVWLDGKQMSLGGIDAILAGFGDWRIAVAAPGVRADRAPLPARPFGGEDIDERIDQRIDAYFASDERFQIDHEYRRVLVRPHLWPFRQEMIDAYNRTYHTHGATMLSALLPYVKGSALRRLQDAVGYEWTPAPPRQDLVLQWP